MGDRLGGAGTLGKIVANAAGAAVLTWEPPDLEASTTLHPTGSAVRRVLTFARCCWTGDDGEAFLLGWRAESSFPAWSVSTAIGYFMDNLRLPHKTHTASNRLEAAGAKTPNTCRLASPGLQPRSSKFLRQYTDQGLAQKFRHRRSNIAEAASGLPHHRGEVEGIFTPAECEYIPSPTQGYDPELIGKCRWSKLLKYCVALAESLRISRPMRLSTQTYEAE